MIYYTTLGPVRGCCGHKHLTIRTAAECMARDDAGCRRQGGYSDRRVLHVPDDIATGDLSVDRIACEPSDVTMGEYMDDRPQWVDATDLPDHTR